MKTYEGISAAATDLNTWFWTNRTTIPVHVAEQIEPLLGQTRSPVDAIVNASEIVFANREAAGMPSGLLEVAAGLAVVASVHGFHGMDQESRGVNISLALRRQLGETAPEGGWPAPEDDPEPKEQYVRVGGEGEPA